MKNILISSLLTVVFSAVLYPLKYMGKENYKGAENMIGLRETSDLIELSDTAALEIFNALDLKSKKYICLLKSFHGQSMILHFIEADNSIFHAHNPRKIKIGTYLLPFFAEHEFTMSNRFNQIIEGGVRSQEFLFHKFLYVDYWGRYKSGHIAEMKWVGN